MHADSRNGPHNAVHSVTIQWVRRGLLGIVALFFVASITVTISGLAFLTQKSGGRLWPVASAGILLVFTAAGLVLFGIWLFHNLLPGHDFSRLIWWLF